MFSKSESLMRKDYSLVDSEIYHYVTERNKDEMGFHDSITDMYKKNAKWCNSFVKVFINILSLLLSPRGKKVKYFFWGSKYEQIILGMPREEVLVLGGPKQIIFCLKNNISFFPVIVPWSKLLKGLKGTKTKNDIEVLLKQANKIKRLIENCVATDSVFIVDNDSLPIQRYAINIFRAKEIKTICIQHGVFSSKSKKNVMDGWYADLFMAFNEQQKIMLIEKGMDANRIKVMGFHSAPYMVKRPISGKGKRKVCFLGQPWHKYGAERAVMYKTIVKNVAALLSSHNIGFFYKPHPWEQGAEHLKDIDNVVNINLPIALENYDVFVSLTSTALIEAQAAGRIAIQIMSSYFDADDLSVHGNISVVCIDEDKTWPISLRSIIDINTSQRIENYQPAENFINALK